MNYHNNNDEKIIFLHGRVHFYLWSILQNYEHLITP